MQALEFKINSEHNGVTVERFLRNVHKMSGRTLKKLKRTEGGLLRNGSHIRSVDILNEGDVLRLGFCDEKPAKPTESLPLDIVYEDNEYLVCNKPPCMPSHPSIAHSRNTLANAVAAYYRSKGIGLTFRALNRLDKDTSGLVVAAKHQFAASLLPGTFFKEYLCVAEGVIERGGTIDAPIKKRDHEGIRRIVSEDGERAVTHYQVLRVSGNTTLLLVTLETGRTHQIRTHFSHIGHPLAGDTLYGSGNEQIPRQALHCCHIRFMNPVTKELVDVRAGIPDDLLNFMKNNGYSINQFNNFL